MDTDYTDFAPSVSARPGTHHARYIRPGVPQHVFSRTLRGEFLLRPNDATNRVIAGVVAKAQANWPDVRLYAVAVLSNHFHAMVQGDNHEVSRFVGFIKLEISRRLGQLFDEPGAMWDRRYMNTALPSEQSQLQCFEYILSQGAKEGLVGRPQDWPGVHFAKAFASGKPISGAWFDGTSYGRAKHAGRKPAKRDYWQQNHIELHQLPALAASSAQQYRNKVLEMLDGVIKDCAQRREQDGNAKVLGAKAVCRQDRRQRRRRPVPVWYEARRRCICAWTTMRDANTRAYVKAYQEFQQAFRVAADEYGRCDKARAAFPGGAFAPCTAVA